MKRILIIDDEANFGRMVKINLEQDGKFAVDTALNAEQGFECVKQQKYDIIFLDVLMPKIEGHEALKVIRTLCQTPVVMISAYLPPQRRDAILEAGAFAVLEKPVPLDILLKVIDDIGQAS